MELTFYISTIVIVVALLFGALLSVLTNYTLIGKRRYRSYKRLDLVWDIYNMVMVILLAIYLFIFLNLV